MKGEVKRGEVVQECTGPEGERGGRNEGKRVGGKGVRKHTRKTLILVWSAANGSLRDGGLSKSEDI